MIVPFEAPAVGADWSTALYQFMCFSSCAGGLNRRQVLLVFTIEMPVTQSPSPSDPNRCCIVLYCTVLVLNNLFVCSYRLFVERGEESQ